MRNIVLLPGSMCDSDLWRDMVPDLAPLGQLHYGNLFEDDTLEGMARRVLAGAPERFVLVGFSMGGWTATEMATMNSSRLSKLILVDSVGVKVGGREDRLVGRGEGLGVYYLDENADGMLAQVESLADELMAGLDRAALQSRLPAGGARNAVDCALWDLEAKASGRSIWELTEVAPKTLETKRDTVAKFLRAWRRGAADFVAAFQQPGGYEGKPEADALIAIIARHTKLEPAEIKMSLPFIDARGSIPMDEIRLQIETFKRMGMADQSVTAEMAVDASLSELSTLARDIEAARALKR